MPNRCHLDLRALRGPGDIAATGPNTVELPVAPGNSRTIYHADLRPTVEVLLGLEPADCAHPTCGQAIRELIAIQP